MNVVVLHAYSADNPGDALLVDLTLDLLREAFGDVRVTLVALDAASFAGRPGVDVLPWATGARLPGRLAILATLARAPRAVRARLATADLVVGVGGGYLRGASCAEVLKCRAAHLTQLGAARRAPAPRVYLPQSVGPFPWPVRGRVHRLLSGALVLARDDVTARAVPRAVRVPDLAVLEVARREPQPRPVGPGAVLVARRLRRPRGYPANLLAFAAQAGPCEWAGHARGRGNDDGAFVRSLGVPPGRPLAAVLSGSGAVPVVVSARLHAALAAVLHGVPAVHLAAERKGYAAFADLGLAGYALDARSVTPQALHRAVHAVRADPGAYFAALDTAALRARRDDLVARLRDATTDQA